MDDEIYALKEAVETCAAQSRNGLVDAVIKQRAETARRTLAGHAERYARELADAPCDPSRYFERPAHELECRIFLLDLMEDWHDVYPGAIREERWFVRHFLNALRRQTSDPQTAAPDASARREDEPRDR